jgi:long-subunit fatty acid transport protein
LPGSASIDLAVGAGYQPYDDTQIDVAYQLAIFQPAGIHLDTPTEGKLNGQYELKAHLFSVQFRRLF